MSEYQYYEFQAIDRPLTAREMAELRASSTRARITPASFVNEYSWGDFKGDEDAWMEKYFDAFLYLANWGTHILKLRVPERLLDAKTARLYAAGEHASVREKNGKVILTFHSEDETGGGWVEGEGRLASLVPARAELARGDLRALYLGWLLCAQSGDLDDDDVEPPVPAGLTKLSASLESLVEFLRIDMDLLRVAAAASPPLADGEPNPADVRRWLAGLSVAEKDDVLARLIVENDGVLVHEFVQRMRREGASEREPSETARRRTVTELLRDAEKAGEERRRIAAEKAARERARRERETAIAREKHLDGLVGREPAIWRRVESLIAVKQPKAYDEAVALLVDLRDLAARKGGGDFRLRIEALRAEHARKPTLIDRLNKAGLGSPAPPNRGRVSGDMRTTAGT
ncbi:MAG: hypothetical protein ACREQ9_22390 [Candidatus Binatia bacterium]